MTRGQRFESTLSSATHQNRNRFMFSEFVFKHVAAVLCRAPNDNKLLVINQISKDTLALLFPFAALLDSLRTLLINTAIGGFSQPSPLPF